jgi:pimeloyl-ACP methyl ester carboxylesterase
MLGTPREVAACSLDAADAVDAAAALRPSTCPVLYIAASRPREENATLRALRPDIAYGQVVGSGHFVQLDATRQVNAMLDRFCDLWWPPTPQARRAV